MEEVMGSSRLAPWEEGVLWHWIGNAWAAIRLHWDIEQAHACKIPSTFSNGNTLAKGLWLVLTAGFLRAFALSFSLQGYCQQLPLARSRGCLRQLF